MPVKHIIGSGIGFSPGGVDYIVTRGLSPGDLIEYEETGIATLILSGSGIGAIAQLLAAIMIYAGSGDASIFSGSGTIDVAAGDDTIPAGSNK